MIRKFVKIFSAFCVIKIDRRCAQRTLLTAIGARVGGGTLNPHLVADAVPEVKLLGDISNFVAW
jgi:hypothetical protein